MYKRILSMLLVILLCVLLLSKYTGNAAISSYAKTSAAMLVKSGIIIGNGNIINPKGYTTREEMAVVVYRIFNN